MRVRTRVRRQDSGRRTATRCEREREGGCARHMMKLNSLTAMGFVLAATNTTRALEKE